MADRIENPSFHLENSSIPLFVFSQIFLFYLSGFMQYALNRFKNQQIFKIFP